MSDFAFDYSSNADVIARDQMKLAKSLRESAKEYRKASGASEKDVTASKRAANANRELARAQRELTRSLKQREAATKSASKATTQATGAPAGLTRGQKAQRVLQGVGRIGGAAGGLFGGAAEGAGAGGALGALAVGAVAVGVALRSLGAAVRRSIEDIQENRKAQVSLSKSMHEARRGMLKTFGGQLKSSDVSAARGVATLGAEEFGKLRTQMFRAGFERPTVSAGSLASRVPKELHGTAIRRAEEFARLGGGTAEEALQRMNVGQLRTGGDLGLREMLSEAMGRTITQEGLASMRANIAADPTQEGRFGVRRARAGAGLAITTAAEGRARGVAGEIQRQRGETLSAEAEVQRKAFVQALDEAELKQHVADTADGVTKLVTLITNGFTGELGLDAEAKRAAINLKGRAGLGS